MNRNAELRRLLWELIKSNMPVFSTGQCYEAVVKSVDAEALTCEVSPADHSEITITARLTSVIDAIEDYLVVLPAEGSTVLVQAIKDDPDNLFVAKVREVSEYRFKIGEMVFKSSAAGHEFNGGELGGMTITPTLVQELNKTNSYLTTLKTATKAIATAVDALASGTSVTFETAMTAVEVGDYTQIENDKVKH